MAEQIAVVDNNNRFLRWEDRAEIHNQQLVHRSVHVLIIDSENRLILQRRHPQKQTWPNHWDISCCGHVAAEDYIAGPDEFLDAVYDAVAERELLEELGVSARLTFINHFPPESGVHYEQIRLYSGVSDGPFSLQEEEVSEIKAVTHKEYDMMLATKQPLTDALKRFVQWSRDHHIWVESP